MFCCPLLRTQREVTPAAPSQSAPATDAADGASMSLVDVEGRTTCMVTVIDTPKAKTLNCGNA